MFNSLIFQNNFFFPLICHSDHSSHLLHCLSDILLMSNSSLNYFEKSIKNHKKILNGIFIINLISFVFYSIFPFIISFLYSNINSLGIDRESIWLMIFIFTEFTPFVIPILSLLLHFFVTTIITNKIQDYKLKEIFKSIKSLTNLSFI